jgi:hypothetical protein
MKWIVHPAKRDLTKTILSATFIMAFLVFVGVFYGLFWGILALSCFFSRCIHITFRRRMN